MQKIELIGCRGCGSAIAEIFLTLAGSDYDRREANYDEPGAARDYLFSKNPLGQVPTLILKDGSILTETLAIAHYAQKLKPDAGLIPQEMPAFAKFYRWAVFMVSALYPTWTYGDFPDKWVPGSADAKLLKTTTDEHRKKLWMQIENEIEGSYFLGDKFSAIDIYIAVMTNWRPGAKWFVENYPKVVSIASKVKAIPQLGQIFSFNFEG